MIPLKGLYLPCMLVCSLTWCFPSSVDNARGCRLIAWTPQKLELVGTFALVETFEITEPVEIAEEIEI